MAILTGDLQVHQSDTMNDTDQGGGAISSSVVVDGQSNNIFEDVSTLDRVFGAVKMRKIFPQVFTQNNDKYFGSHFIISKLPLDNKIGVNLFNTVSAFDRRPVASSRVENYLAQGGAYTGSFVATQFTGSKTLTIYQAVTVDAPAIGGVLFLTNNALTEQQYVKVVNITESIDVFTDVKGDFTVKVLVIEISQALRYDFIGVNISRSTVPQGDGLIFDTVVANASKYFSARRLALQANDTDLSVKVDSVFSQLIPSSLTELALLDLDASGTSQPVIDKASGGVVNVTVSNNGTWNVNEQIYLGSPCVPGTFLITSGTEPITDNGGQLIRATISVGTINYSTGVATFGVDVSSGFSGNGNVQFKPAVAPTKISDTAVISVTPSNRGFIWNINLNPKPEPGSVTFSYRSLGNWFTLYDTGGGELKATETGIGVGTINYATGTVSVTTSALPDSESVIIFTWGTAFSINNRSNITPDKLSYDFTLADKGVISGTVVITWNDGVARTATDNGGGGFTGDGIGKINYFKGTIEFSPNTLPLGGTQFNIAYDHGTPLQDIVLNPIPTNSIVNYTIAGGNLTPSTIEVNWVVKNPNYYIRPIANPLLATEFGYVSLEPTNKQLVEKTITAKDDGLGAIIDPSGINIGTVDYLTGAISINVDFSIDVKSTLFKNVIVP